MHILQNVKRMYSRFGSKSFNNICEEALQFIERIRAYKDFQLIKAHLNGFDSRDKINYWLELLEKVVVKKVPNFSNSLGLDFGCWSGFGSWLLSMFGPKHIFAIDINESFVRFARTWARDLKLERITFIANSYKTIPLLSESIDWIYINQVFCNMNPEYFEYTISEICRVLKPRGKLLFCDSNNPYCPETLERLKKNYRQRELGDGTSENPNGPLFKSRCRFISELAPDLNQEIVKRLAKNTCYLWGYKLEYAINNYLVNGVEPISPFRDSLEKAPLQPNYGGGAGNITDPFWFLTQFEKGGIQNYITTNTDLEPTDSSELFKLLNKSQGFFIFGTKSSNPKYANFGKEATL